MIKLNNINNNKKKGEEAMNLLERFAIQEESYMVPLYAGEGKINKEMIENLNKNIDCDQLTNKSKALAVMSYTYGSLVGVTTTGVSLGLSVLNNVDQFFDGDTLSVMKARKVFKNIGKNYEKGYRYQTVFPKANRITVINKFGVAVEMVRVSAHEVREFDERLKRVDIYSCTKEDMKLIARDLDTIGRALQELAIDVTKDKSKDIGYNIMDFITTSTKTHSRKIAHGNFTNNIQEVINNHFKRVAAPNYKIETKFIKLADADVNSRSEMSEAVVEDVAGIMMEAINDGYTDTMNTLCDKFKLANSKMYAEYFTLIEVAKKADSENAKKVAHMIKCSIVAMSAITSLYSLRDDNAAIDGAYIKEIASKLRAGLYTEADQLGYKASQVVKFAIAGAFCYLKAGKITVKAKPSFTQLWTMFDKEFIIEYLAINGEATIKDMLTVKYNNFDICLGQELAFVDGMAEVKDAGYVVVTENYTGKAVVTEDGVEAIVNHYDYEPTKVLFLDRIYTPKVVAIVPGQAYKRPESILVRDKEDKNYKMHNKSISKLAYTCEQMRVVAGKDGIKDVVIKKGAKLCFLGTSLSVATGMMEASDAIITNGYGGVVFLK